MFTAPLRHLPYPVDSVLAVEAETPDQEVDCVTPAFPEDSDQKVTVLFRLSLNEFVAIASAIDAGRDIAFGSDAVKIWWLWVANLMCASFCEEMAQCLTDQNEALMTALADALTSNPLLIAAIGQALSENGSGIPGQPLTSEQAERDFLPAGVRDEEGACIDNALWGACLYLVQSGNRAITDFFEQTEAASNNLEAAGIIAQNVPAAGSYAASALEFADQIIETLQEGYAAAYTETYENELACDIFCRARVECDLTPDMLIQAMEARLGYDATTDFGVLMARVGTGVFVGSGIADSAFYIYFSALRFGQKFMDILSFKTLSDMMSLGADLLASDNWLTLCNCPEAWCISQNPASDLETAFTAAFGNQAQWNGTGWGRDTGGVPSRVTIIETFPTTITPTSVTVVLDAPQTTGDSHTINLYTPGFASLLGSLDASTGTEFEFAVGVPLSGINIDLVSDVSVGGGAVPATSEIIEVRMNGFDTPPDIGEPC